MSNKGKHDYATEVVVEIRSKEWTPKNHQDTEDAIKIIVCDAYNGTKKARNVDQTISVDDVKIDWKLANAEIAKRHACDEVLVYIHVPQNIAFVPDVLTIQNGMKLLFPGFEKHFGVQAVRDGQSFYVPSDKPISSARRVFSFEDMVRT